MSASPLLWVSVLRGSALWDCFRWGCLRLVGTLLLLVLLATHADAQALPSAADSRQAAAVRNSLALESHAPDAPLEIPVGQSLLLHAAQPVRRVYVGDSKILQTFSSSPTEIVLTAKAAGVTSLVLWNTDGHSCLYTVVASLDSGDLADAIHQQYPELKVRVHAREDRVMLSGDVPSAQTADALLKMAAAYSKDVVNALRIVAVHAPQVELSLRIIEVDRSRLEQFGFNFYSLGGNSGGSSTQQFLTTATTNTSGSTSTVSISNPLNLFFFNSAKQLGASLQDLEQKQVLQVLAEPTLTTLSEQPARFLSGGEFPFPVVQGGTANSTAVTIQFRPYGVRVDFTPYVNPDGTIRMKVEPEVSTLDYTNAVTISGFTIPAISTRRAETEVELRDGQTFMLSGLLDHRATENLNRMPGIANIPILGQLFRSKNINHSVVELVVMATVHVVHPLDGPVPVKQPEMPVRMLHNDEFDRHLPDEKHAGEPVKNETEKP